MIHHPIPSGLYCVPTAICALTGADPQTVVFPALNRHSRSTSLLTAVEGVRTWSAGVAVLGELGYRVRPYRHRDLRARLSTWVARSRKYPGRPLLVTVRGHALVIEDGFIYDPVTPWGAQPEDHPDRNRIVLNAALVEPVR